MPQYLENFGLESFKETEESFRGLIGYSLKNGEAITGYYGLPYYNYHFGSVQMIVRTNPREDGDGLEVSGLDTHADGRAIWDVRIAAPDLDPDGADRLSRRVAVEKADGSGGTAVINIVNADVLPSIMEGDLIKLQVLAFPELIEYYEDEEAFAAAQPELRNGRKFLLTEGTFFPTGLLKNRDPESPDYGKDEHLDNIVNVRGTVQSARYGRFIVKEEEYTPYIVTTIDTCFGPLEIIHSPLQVDEKLRKNIRVGAIVNMYGLLSGDAAIYEYEHGIIKDEEHNLALLRYTFSGHDPERLRPVLTDDTVYTAEFNGLQFKGPDAIIERMKTVQAEGKYRAHMATIISIDNGEDDNGSPEYGVGKRCIAIMPDEEKAEYESIAFVEVDEGGNILRLRTSIDPRYHFRIDEKPKKWLDEQLENQKSIIEPILGRARFHRIIDSSVTDEMVLNDSRNINEYSDNIRQMLQALPDTDNAEQQKKNMRNLFGYLFAKAAEMEYAENNRITSFSQICAYSPSDCFAGRFVSALDEKRQKALEDAMELGGQFYGDCTFFWEHHPDEQFSDIIHTALMLTQILGRLYSYQCLDW